jgi:hypothetical protein
VKNKKLISVNADWFMKHGGKRKIEGEELADYGIKFCECFGMSQPSFTVLLSYIKWSVV